MRFTIASPKGLISDREIDYVVSCGKDGQLGILENHLPVVVPISEGYIKTVTNGVEEFYAVSGAILEFKNNIVNVIAQEALYGKTKDEAFVNLEAERTLRKSENHRKMMDFTEMERELALNIKQIKASQL